MILYVIWHTLLYVDERHTVFFYFLFINYHLYEYAHQVCYAVTHCKFLLYFSCHWWFTNVINDCVCFYGDRVRHDGGLPRSRRRHQWRRGPWRRRNVAAVHAAGTICQSVFRDAAPVFARWGHIVAFDVVPWARGHRVDATGQWRWRSGRCGRRADHRQTGRHGAFAPVSGSGWKVLSRSKLDRKMPVAQVNTNFNNYLRKYHVKNW